MQFKRLDLKDGLVFRRFLSQRKHSLSAYAFENIFVWKSLYDIFWTKIEKNLCVFFKDRIGCFLFLPPLGKNLNRGVIGECFKVMDRYNKNPILSRIENVEVENKKLYENLGFSVILGGCDYVCKRKELVDLKGDHFKNKRSAFNYFINNYGSQYQSYSVKHKDECLRLYRLWMRERKAKNKDMIYRKLLDDNFSIFKMVLKHYKKANFIGRIVKVDNKIGAVTFGYSLGNNSLVILFEVCDLKFKGIAQYIFREFCREQKYENINIMDDSGLDNLKRVKLSYRPYKIVDNFIVRNG